MFAKYIANRSDIDPNGTYDIIAYGSWKGIEVNSSIGITLIDSRQAAKLIRKQPGFKKQRK